MSNCRDLQWKGDGTIGVPTYFKPDDTVSSYNPIIVINKITDIKEHFSNKGSNFKVLLTVLVIFFILQQLARRFK